jgi:hypothetical protein
VVINIEPVLGSPELRDEDVRLQSDGWSWAGPGGLWTAQYELSLALLPNREWAILNFPDGWSADPLSPPFY